MNESINAKLALTQYKAGLLMIAMCEDEKESLKIYMAKYPKVTGKAILYIGVLDQRIESEKKIQGEIVSKINGLDDVSKIILQSVYIDGKTLLDVSKELNYSYTHVKKLHGKALTAFEKA